MRRLSHNDLLADVAAFVAMGLFLAALFGFLPDATDAVAAWRLGR
jgi:hypothetical protein